MENSIVSIIGATASGKSAVALKLAEMLNGEIISGDSMQVYRGMDIGTAKPDLKERELINHHLIDIKDISEPYSLSDFISNADEAVTEIRSKGKLPIIVGGTGLYINTFLNGTSLVETNTDISLRQKLYEEYENFGAEYIHRKLFEVDEISARSIHPNNVKRVIRALEIYLTTGVPKSVHDQNSKSATKKFNSYIYCLDYADRESLYQRIDLRVDFMREQGLENEVDNLKNQGLFDTPTASQAIGYKEFIPYFSTSNIMQLDEVFNTIKQSSRNYAKRQITFFKRVKDRIVVSADGLTNIERAEYIYNHFISNIRN